MKNVTTFFYNTYIFSSLTLCFSVEMKYLFPRDDVTLDVRQRKYFNLMSYSRVVHSIGNSLPVPLTFPNLTVIVTLQIISTKSINSCFD